MVDIAVCYWSLDTLKGIVQREIFNELLKDVALRMSEIDGTGHTSRKPFKKPECTYHEHVKAGSTCYLTML